MADHDNDTLAYDRAAEQAPHLEWLGSRLVGTWEISGDVRGKVTYEWMDGGFFRDTLDYVYELEGDTLTIWVGERDSPAYYMGTFGDDGDTLTGAWHHPGRPLRDDFYQGRVTDTPGSKSPPGRLQRLTR
jgi:hypothetical protein